MFVLKLTLVACHVALVLSQGPTTTPVPILKQINKQNDDGSYSFGYEAADGSFKIETKYPNGDVAGKYGYVDESGKLREISYGASSKRGFEPQGAGIVVPPPSLSEPSTNALTDGQEDDGQYREDPKIYEDPKYNTRQQKTRTGPVQSFRQFQQPAFPQPAFTQQAYQPAPQPAPQRQTYTNTVQNQNSIYNQFPQQFPTQETRPQSQVYHQQPQFSFQGYTPQQGYQQNYQQSYQPAFQQQQYQPNYQSQYQSQNYNPFFGHPAQNFDPSTGSYTINFTG